jgi:hypothetical protein
LFVTGIKMAQSSARAEAARLYELAAAARERAGWGHVHAGVALSYEKWAIEIDKLAATVDSINRACSGIRAQVAAFSHEAEPSTAAQAVLSCAPARQKDPSRQIDRSSQSTPGDLEQAV